MEQNKSIQKQIDWINVNLRREIQERMGADARISATIWHLDQRIQKLEKSSRFGNRMRLIGLVVSFMLMLGLVIKLNGLF